ncbi:MAG: hypothetical protein ACRDGO_10520 [Actinomycetota bacterium]
MSAILGFVLLTGCADTPAGPGGEGPVNIVEIVCEADGSTTVRTPEVSVQPDGVHVHVLSRLDEPASVGAFAMDVEPGTTEFVSTVRPGEVDAACYPFSEHGPGGSEPQRTPVEVLDPDGLFVDGEVTCSGSGSSMIADYLEPPLDAGPVPLDVARESIRGLLPNDDVLHLGYPEQGGRQVAVRRDGTIVATFDFLTFDGDEWQIASNEICSSSGLG